jgi:DNA-binding MarR family transcriptional regulator
MPLSIHRCQPGPSCGGKNGSVSNRLINLVKADGRLKDPFETTIMLLLADCCGPGTNHCYPSVETLAKWARVTPRGVQKILNRLVQCGLIKKSPGGGRRRPNGYQLYDKSELAASKILKFTDDLQEATCAVKRPQPKTTTKNFNIDEVIFPEGFDTPEFREAVLGWVEVRKSKRNIPTAYACNLAIQKLAKFGLKVAIEQFNLSAMSGWSGVFPPKSPPQSPKVSTNRPCIY